jgi:hypothetical protein
MTPVVVAFETAGCRFAAQIAVDALIIYIECPRYVSAYLFATSAIVFTVKVGSTLAKTLSAQLNRRREQNR